MLVLLTLLAVGMLSLSTVSLRSSKGGSAQLEARANARLALQLAIGELQMSMGPDQAVSAPASIFDSDPESQQMDGVANPLWVLALPSVDPDGTSSLETSAEDNRRYALGLSSEDRVKGVRPSSRAMRWLVSMPPSATADPAQALDSSVGEILGADEVVKLQEARTEIDGKDKTLEVEVGKVAIRNDSGVRTGSYAWWVGDEGIKAKFTMADSDPDLKDTRMDEPVSPEQWRLTQGRGLHLDHVSAQPPHSVLATDEELGKVVSSDSLDLLSDSWREWHGRNSADITVHGHGLPVDVAEGRLKQDLSVYLETGKGLDGGSDILRGGNGDGDYTGPEFPVEFADHDNLPKFGLLKGWHDLGREFADGSVKSRPHTLSQHGLHPHVKRSGVCMSIVVKEAPREIKDDPNTLEDETDPNNYEAEFVLVLFPFIELWNPYTVALPPEKYLAEVTAPNRVILNWSDNAQHGMHITNPHPGSPPNAVVDFDLLADGLINPVNGGNYQFGEKRPWLRMVVDTGDLGNGPDGLMPGESVLVSPVLGSIPSRSYRKDLDYLDYKAGTTENMAEHKMIDQHAYTTPDGCYIFHDFAKKGKLPKPGASRRYYRVRYKNPSLKDGTSDPKWGGTDNTPLFRLSRLDSGGPTLLAYRDPTRADFDSINNNRQGWDWAHNGSKVTDRSGVPPVSAFSGLPRLDLGNFADNSLRNTDSIFMDAPALGPGWVQGGYRTLGTENPRGGILRTNDQLPASWQYERWGNRPGHRHDPYEHFIFSGNWRLPARLGVWGRYGGIEGFIRGGTGGNADLQSGTTYAHFDFPRRHGPLHSLGQLLHANLNPMPWGSAYQVGYSRAPKMIARNLLTGDSSTWQLKNQDIDLPYLVNASIWDRFYLSTIPQNGSLDLGDGRPPLANHRYQLRSTPASPLASAELQDSETAFQQSAANVVIDGCFNINSTSVTAWEAFLLTKAGTKLEVDGRGRTDNQWREDYNADGDEELVLFPRVPDPVFGVESNAAFDSQHPRKSYFTRAGNHITSRSEVRKLAESIVAEVKRRGPFLSMGDFVNRRLVGNSNDLDVDYLGLMGTLDAAILRASQEEGVLNHQLIFGEDANNIYGTKLDPDEQLHPNGQPSSADEKERYYAVPRGHVDTGLEGVGAYLMQGDILTHLGANLSARSDCFTIRSYGESLDPSGKVLATARCEAVVQRVVEPLDPADDLVKPTGRMGRRFEIVSFRWMNREEL